MSSLRVYIAKHCPTCAFTVTLVQEVRHAYPHVEVYLIDVEQAGRERAELLDEVLFTPGYFLNGRPISWGNPDRDALFRMLDAIDHPSI